MIITPKSDGTDSFIQNIETFPEPKSLTDVRAWFGTVKQISYAFAITTQMEPFHTLLSTVLQFLSN